MKAKCPHCLPDNGCEKCNFTGQIDVDFAEGEWFTRVCLNPECLFVNGGRICNGFPLMSSGPCVMCEGETKWVSMDDPILEEIGEPWIQNQYKFTCTRLEKDLISLREKLKETRDFAKNIPGFKDLQLSVKEAQLMKVCRICKEVDSPRTIDNKTDPFVMNYGEEYAHKSCLQPKEIK